MTTSLTLYVDYRSPFSYLLKDDAYALERDFDVKIDWRPFAVDIECAYGGTVDERTERDWRKVRYSYMDARRLANRRNLIVRGPQKIFNANNVHIGMLFALRAGDQVFRRYHDEVYERFWRRDLEIEDLNAIRDVLVTAGANGADFDSGSVGQRPSRVHANCCRGRCFRQFPSHDLCEEPAFVHPSSPRWCAAHRWSTLGAFALREPDHGSDSVALETTAKREGDEWVINGRKRWPGNAVWCRLHRSLRPRRRR
jgi:2-hydroxychromene-2-carboxylate isomerase